MGKPDQDIRLPETIDPDFKFQLEERLNNVIDYVSKDIDSCSYFTSEKRMPSRWHDESILWHTTVNFGALPNTTAKTVAHSIDGTIANIVRIDGVAKNGTTYLPLPYVDTTTGNLIELAIIGDNVSITTAADYSSYTAYVNIIYTKS